MTQSLPMLAMLLSGLAMAFFTAFDTTTKALAVTHPVFEMMAVEFAVAALCQALFAAVRGRAALAACTPRNWRYYAICGAIRLAAMLLFFSGIRHVAMTEFYIILFTVPLLTPLLSALMLKEHGARSLLAALAVCFCGVLIALQPEAGFNPWWIALFFGSLCNAGNNIAIRFALRTESPAAFALWQCVLISACLAVTLLFDAQPLGWPELGWAALGGVFYGCATRLYAMAMARAAAPLVAAMQFLQLIYGGIAGWLVFNHVPPGSLYIGGAIVIAANLFVLITTMRAAKRAAAAQEMAATPS